MLSEVKNLGTILVMKMKSLNLFLLKFSVLLTSPELLMNYCSFIKHNLLGFLLFFSELADFCNLEAGDWLVEEISRGAPLCLGVGTFVPDTRSVIER